MRAPRVLILALAPVPILAIAGACGTYLPLPIALPAAGILSFLAFLFLGLFAIRSRP